MTVDTTIKAIVNVLEELQRVSGRPCGQLTGSTKPIGDLVGFDSLSGIEATVALEAALDLKLETDNALVAEVKGRKRALTITEAAERIAKHLNTKVA